MDSATTEQVIAAPDVRTIGSLEELDHAFALLADLEREQEENARVEALAIARIKFRTSELNATLEKQAAFYRSQIQAYAEAHKSELLHGGKKKSRVLLHGTVAWRKSGGKLEVTDSEALLEWARLQPVELNLLRIKESPALDEIKLHVGKTGELPPGTELSEEKDELSIKAIFGEVSHGNN